MATTAAPYGLKPVKRVDGMPYAGAVDEFAFNPAGYGTAVYNGSVVAFNASTGYIELDPSVGTVADPLNAVGVFVGCEYINAQGQLIHSQYYPANATNAVAKVVTDPNVVFQAQAAGPIGFDEIGFNIHLDAQTGSAATGNSTTTLDVDTASDATARAFKIVGFVSTPDDNFTDVLVKFNPTHHMMARDGGKA